MISLHNKTKGSVIATRKVERKTVSRWGILGFKNKAKNSFIINDVVEKPKLSEAPSNYAHNWKIYFTDENTFCFKKSR